MIREYGGAAWPVHSLNIWQCKGCAKLIAAAGAKWGKGSCCIMVQHLIAHEQAHSSHDWARALPPTWSALPSGFRTLSKGELGVHIALPGLVLLLPLGALEMVGPAVSLCSECSLLCASC